MTDILVVLAVGLIVGLAVLYIYKAKKRGQKCIGCPDSGACSGKCSSCSGCACSKKEN